MRNRAMVPILIGVVAAGLGLYVLMTGPKEAPKDKTIQIVVAKDNIERLAKVDWRNQFAIKEYPEGSQLIPEGALTRIVKKAQTPDKPDETIFLTLDKKEVEQLNERVFVAPAFKGAPVLVQMLSKPGEAGGATQLKAGMVAVSVNVDEKTLVSGLVKPGSRVNIMVTIMVQDRRSNEQRSVCFTALRDVEVFAVGGQIQAPEPSGTKRVDRPATARTVTFAVTAKEAKYITLLEEKGKITLALVSSKPGEDDLNLKDPPTTVQQVLEELGGFASGSQQQSGVSEVRLVQQVLNLIAAAPSAAPVAAPKSTPAPNTVTPTITLPTPTPTPEPVTVVVRGPRNQVITEVMFQSYDATAPMKGTGGGGGFVPPQGAPVAPIGVPQPPPLAPVGGGEPHGT